MLLTIRKDKEQIVYKVTYARLKYIWLGWVGRGKGGKEASNGAGGNLGTSLS